MYSTYLTICILQLFCLCIGPQCIDHSSFVYVQNHRQYIYISFVYVQDRYLSSDDSVNSVKPADVVYERYGRASIKITLSYIFAPMNDDNFYQNWPLNQEKQRERGGGIIQSPQQKQKPWIIVNVHRFLSSFHIKFHPFQKRQAQTFKTRFVKLSINSFCKK